MGAEAAHHSTPTTSGNCATLAEDYSCSTDVSAQYPEKLKEMQAAFMEEAVKYNVLPLDDRAQERFNATLAGRPEYMGGRTSLTLYPGMIGMKENAFIDVKNRSSSITAELETAAVRASSSRRAARIRAGACTSRTGGPRLPTTSWAP